MPGRLDLISLLIAMRTNNEEADRVTADPASSSEPEGKVAESNEGSKWTTRTNGMPHISPQPMRHKE
jgi:hypothetical protein